MTPLVRALARPLRLEYPGALWHVTNRGVEKRTIYVDDDDRHRFLARVACVVDERRWQIPVYVLMSNHYHLLVRTPAPNLSCGMRDLDAGYASSFNERHTRVGHLFQGRFKSHLIDSDAYLLEVARYIVLNPVRAGLVSSAAEWPWSSYRATAGLSAVLSWLDPTPILDRFDPLDWNRAKHEYRAFVAAGVGQARSPWEDLVAQVFLGRAEFLREVEQKVHEKARSDQHRRDQRAFRAVTLDQVGHAVNGADDRLLFVILATRHTNATRAEIGRRLGITGAGVAYLIRSASDRVRSDRAFADRLKAAEARLRTVDVTSR